MIGLDFSLEAREALEYLRGKGFKLSFDYNEMESIAHHKAFTAAKVMRLDLLNDIFESIESAMSEGKGFKQFQKELKPTLMKKGWWGEQDIVNPKTGEVKTINIGSRRLKTIYYTNMRVAYNVGRYKQMMELPVSVYWRYSALMDSRTRKSHAAIHGVVLHRDNAFWRENYPPNGWFCRCKVRAYSRSQVEKKGWSVSEKVSGIADKDWAYDVGAGAKVGKLSKIDLDNSLDGLQSVKSIKKSTYADMSENELKKSFYDTLGVAEGAMFIDKIGDPMIVDDELFKSASGHSKITKQDRALYIDEIAKTIAEPDEIYIEWDAENKRLLKKMFRYYKTEEDAKRATTAMFKYEDDKTIGVTGYFVKGSGQVEGRRKVKLIYQKEQG